MSDLVDIHLVGLPLRDQQLAAQHFDELLREFTMLELADGSGQGVPARLIRLREQLNSRFERFTAGVAAVIQAAHDRGDNTVDVTYQVPPDVAEAAIELGALLDEADGFCRQGDHLLTLATPEPALRYRRWFLGEFARQAAGDPPLPFSRQP